MSDTNQKMNDTSMTDGSISGSISDSKKKDLCQKACAIYRKKSLRFCRFFLFSAVIAMVVIGLQYINNGCLHPFDICAGVLLLLYSLSGIFSNFVGYNSFVDLIDMGEYSIEKQKYGPDDWYFVHISGTNTWVRVEKYE